MDQIRSDEPEGAPACAHNADAGAPSGGAGPERRNSARRKLAAVTRLLRGEPLETVARELGVRYVLEGSVRRAGQRVRVTAQLIDAETAAHLWGDRFDRERSDV